MENYFLANYSNPITVLEKKTDRLLQTNEEAQKYNLCLSQKEAEMVAKTESEAIKAQERIEIGESAAARIADKFMQSTFVSKENYADTLCVLTELFYTVKNESLDVLSDEEVIDVMFEYYEKYSCGSIELLSGRDLGEMCRKVRLMAEHITDNEDVDDNCDDDNYDDGNMEDGYGE